MRPYLLEAMKDDGCLFQMFVVAKSPKAALQKHGVAFLSSGRSLAEVKVRSLESGRKLGHWQERSTTYFVETERHVTEVSRKT